MYHIAFFYDLQNVSETKNPNINVVINDLSPLTNVPKVLLVAMVMTVCKIYQFSLPRR